MAEIQKEEIVILWDKDPFFITIKAPALLGNDCLKLLFWIDEKSFLQVKCIDISGNEILATYKLGEVT